MSDEEADWAEELTRKDGHPVLAMAIAIPILLVSTCGNPELHQTVGSETIAYVAGAVLASVFFFWGIPYLITIRHASDGWKFGTLALVVVMATLANLWVIGGARLRSEQELGTLSKQVDEVAAGTRQELDVGDDATPIGRIGAEVANRNIADLKAYGAALQASGAEKITMLRGLTPNSAELRDCNRFETLRERARNSRGNLATYVADAQKKLEAEVSAGTVSQEAMHGFIKGAEDGRPNTERTWDLLAGHAEAVGELCAILARKNWRVEQGEPAFTSNGDMKAANEQLAKLQAIINEQQQLRTRAQASMKAKAAAAGM